MSNPLGNVWAIYGNLLETKVSASLEAFLDMKVSSSIDELTSKYIRSCFL